MTDLEKAQEMQDLKEQKEVFEEIKKIDNYIEELTVNSSYNMYIQNFIIEIINKYRYKIEVINYYNNPNRKDDLSKSQYDLLVCLRDMIRQYSLIKFGEKFVKENEKGTCHESSTMDE